MGFRFLVICFVVSSGISARLSQFNARPTSIDLSPKYPYYSARSFSERNIFQPVYSHPVQPAFPARGISSTYVLRRRRMDSLDRQDDGVGGHGHGTMNHNMHLMHHSNSASHPTQTHHHNTVEIEGRVEEFLELMGPHFLFLTPFFVKLIPFAIPALPLSYILTHYMPATIPELIERLMELGNHTNHTNKTMNVNHTTGSSHHG